MDFGLVAVILASLVLLTAVGTTFTKYGAHPPKSE